MDFSLFISHFSFDKMSKGKLAKFADMERYSNVFQYPYSVVDNVPFDMKGRWREMYFHNDNPIVLELGCGRGEYAVGLARMFPEVNFIGVDIKGARMWTGATQALAEGLSNVAFLRTNIEIIDRFFAPGEVQEIWLTFSDISWSVTAASLLTVVLYTLRLTAISFSHIQNTWWSITPCRCSFQRKTFTMRLMLTTRRDASFPYGLIMRASG